MFQITDGAAQHLRAALSKAENPEGTCFRIGIADSRVRMALDQERPGDMAIEHEGDTLVVLDRAASDCLVDHQLDYEEVSGSLVLRATE